ncbi:type II secretion system protein GspL [Photobacterium sp. WH77]|uniref:type II secretion system protein GspL n=1 Tax=unclassified Photobacterium TaxID=2628852 RepID=UPI001C452A1B|nr:type II secretion system protein GspL [Photobacterium sp. WH24]MCG2838211.1 type II secretion system protein GspL [Photobacterium sp. WH77]MCG2845828.1 type II secretion system protein GspL [Photobacterium sp. WH80]
MSEFLTIRLSSRPDGPVHWLVWSPQQQEVIASGELADSGQLGELAAYGENRPVYLLVSGSDVLLSQVSIPSGSGRQLAQVLPYLLEEELAQDVDDLHIHMLKREADKADVAVVGHQRMQHWLSLCDDAGLAVRKIIPDCLCLPAFDNSYSAAEIDGQWLLRQSATQGICADTEWLASWMMAQQVPLISQVLEEESPEAQSADAQTAAEALTDDTEDSVSQHRIRHFTPAPSGMPGHWQAEAPELVMALLAKGADDSKVNLLSGPYKLQPTWHKALKPWRKVGIAAVLVLGVLVAEYVVRVQGMENQALAYKTESERIFRQVLPQFNNIPTSSYLKRQMNQELSRLGGAESGQGVLPWLIELRPALLKVPQISVQNLKYDHNRHELRLQAVAAEFQHFEQLRVLLVEGFEVEQGQLNRDGQQVSGALVLRRRS